MKSYLAYSRIVLGRGVTGTRKFFSRDYLVRTILLSAIAAFLSYSILHSEKKDVLGKLFIAFLGLPIGMCLVCVCQIVLAPYHIYREQEAKLSASGRKGEASPNVLRTIARLEDYDARVENLVEKMGTTTTDLFVTMFFHMDIVPFRDFQFGVALNEVFGYSGRESAEPVVSAYLSRLSLLDVRESVRPGSVIRQMNWTELAKQVAWYLRESESDE